MGPSVERLLERTIYIINVVPGYRRRGHLVLAARKMALAAWLCTGIREELRQSTVDRSVYPSCERIAVTSACPMSRKERTVYEKKLPVQ
jgi:hypothetical protein